MIPEGNYRARAVEADLAHAKTGSEQVAVAFEIVERDNQGAQVTWYGYFTEKTRERTLRSLRYCGWDGASLADLSSVGTAEVEIVIEHEPDQNGVLRERVRWVNRVGGGLRLPNRMTGEEAKRFAAQFSPRRTKDEPSNSSTEGSEDDGDDVELPF